MSSTRKEVTSETHYGHGISGTGLDKEDLHGKYQEVKDIERDHLKKRYKLSEEMAQKAADIGLADEDPMHIDIKRGIEGTDLARILESNKNGSGGSVEQTSQKSGVTWKELAVLSAGLVGGFYVWDNKQTPVEPPPATAPVDSEYDVRFYDKDGRLIPLQPLPAELRKKG